MPDNHIEFESIKIEFEKFIMDCNVFLNGISIKGRMSQILKLIIIRKFAERFIDSIRKANPAATDEDFMKTEILAEEIFANCKNIWGKLE